MVRRLDRIVKLKSQEPVIGRRKRCVKDMGRSEEWKRAPSGKSEEGSGQNGEAGCEASWKRRRNVVGLCGGQGGRGMSGVGQTTASWMLVGG